MVEGYTYLFGYKQPKTQLYITTYLLYTLCTGITKSLGILNIQIKIIENKKLKTEDSVVRA